ncbi:MAG: lipase family protein [Acidimicrobiales bacterium]
MAGLLLAAVTLAACTSSTASPAAHPPGVKVVPASATAHGPSSFYRPPDPLTPAPPGTLIRSEIVTGAEGIPSGATLWRILYHSESITGADIAVSGYVAVPESAPPLGGYPVMTWAHGTTGAAVKCAPSLFDGLEGEGPYLVPGIDAYLTAGWLIAATDYQGLGVAAGIHPYLVGASEGYGVLDAAKAARQLPGLHVSPTTLIYGHSQGGHAALFAGELAPSYAPSLHVIGVVAAAPATGLSTIVGVFGQLDDPDDMAYFMLVGWTWSEVYPDLPASDLFTAEGVAFAQRNVTEHCDNGLVAALTGVSPGSLFLPDANSNPAFQARGRLNNPGQVRTQAPMLVVQGTADNQVPEALTDAYVTQSACPIGDVIDYVHYPGAGHDQVTHEAVPRIVAWSEARLHGVKAPSTCGRSSDSITS